MVPGGGQPVIDRLVGVPLGRERSCDPAVLKQTTPLPGRVRFPSGPCGATTPRNWWGRQGMTLPYPFCPHVTPPGVAGAGLSRLSFGALAALQPLLVKKSKAQLRQDGHGAKESKCPLGL